MCLCVCMHAPVREKSEREERERISHWLFSLENPDQYNIPKILRHLKNANDVDASWAHMPEDAVSLWSSEFR